MGISVGMGVSRRSSAAQRGVSDAAVRKAIATEWVTTLPDGTIDQAGGFQIEHSDRSGQATGPAGRDQGNG